MKTAERATTPEEVRRRVIAFRMNEAEYDELERQAADRDLTVSEYIRLRVVSLDGE